MKALKLLIADDHPLLILGIHRTLANEPRLTVVGTVRNGADVCAETKRLQADVVLLDLRMPGLDGLQVLESLREEQPEVKAVVFSMVADPEAIEASFKRGASGFILKTIDPLDLAPAIRQAVEGTAFHARGLPGSEHERATLAAGLTRRELTIMKAVARGLTNDAIAKELWVSEQTIKFHLTNAYRKIGVKNRTEAARWAFDQGLLYESDASARPTATSD
jgi:DNA-binding NarL/FixJ family response regulator